MPLIPTIQIENAIINNDEYKIWIEEDYFSQLFSDDTKDGFEFVL
ncbi:MAG TPA: hypothetical protein VL854_07255 [Nitrososphaeraceae archaeon]|nr:hypothetical protein [Nitrososphaeraceae archaeon]